MKVTFKKTSSVARQPTITRSGSAGCDLYSCESKIIRPHFRELFEIEIKIAIPRGFYGRIAPRSGLSINNSIDVGVGVVDSDFRGVIKVILINHSSCPFSVNLGDKIAQLIFEKIEAPIFVECNNLPATEKCCTCLELLNKNVSYENYRL